MESILAHTQADMVIPTVVALALPAFGWATGRQSKGFKSCSKHLSQYM